MSKNQMIIGGLVLLVLVGGIFFLAKNGQSSRDSDTDQTQSNVQGVATSASTAPTQTPLAMEASGSANEASSSSMQAGVKEFTVTGSNYKFEPATLTVNKGDTVKITFNNSGGFHNFVLDDFNVKTKTIPAGQTDTVTFTASKAGTFSYYCSVGNHRAMGMEGKLTVQ